MPYVTPFSGQLTRLQNTQIQGRSEAEREQVITLPTSIVALERAIAAVVLNLEEFRDLEQASGEC